MWTYSVGNLLSAGNTILWALEQQLVVAGWTKVRDSDGTTYDPAGAQLTHSGAGANGLNNVSAWFVMQAPAIAGQLREFCFQRGATAAGWRVKYSPAAGFIGGAPGATQTPLAADERILAGAGTDAAPTYDVTWQPTATNLKVHIVCGQAAEFYSFFMWSFLNGTSTYSGFASIGLDVMKTATSSAADTDPAVAFAFKSVGVMTTAHMWAGASGWVTAVPFCPLVFQTSNQWWATAAAPSGDPFTGFDQLMPCFWGKMDAVPRFYKGQSTLFYAASVRRTNCDTFNLVGVRDYIYFEALTGGSVAWCWAIPWDGSVPAL
jgi:hypothetical protein